MAKGGGEIFYVTLDGKIMSVSVQLDEGFSFGNSELLVDGGRYYWGSYGRNYDVSPDGERFLVVRPGNVSQEGAAELVYVFNWGEELKRLVPTND